MHGNDLTPSCLVQFVPTRAVQLCKLWHTLTKIIWVFQKLQEESVWIIHSWVETWKKVTLDELASCALLALLWAFVSWFVIWSLHNDFPTDGGFPSPFLSLPRFFGKAIQFDLCDSKTTSFFGVFEIIILPSQKMLCSCWLHCLCPGTCPASWGLRGKDLVFLQHGHMGITVTRQQKRLFFLRGSNMSQRSCHVWSSKAAMKMTLCDNPHSHFPPPHLDPFWHWQHQVERVWWIWSHIASTGGTLSHCPNECQKSRISLWHFQPKSESTQCTFVVVSRARWLKVFFFARTRFKSLLLWMSQMLCAKNL